MQAKPQHEERRAGLLRRSLRDAAFNAVLIEWCQTVNAALPGNVSSQFCEDFRGQSSLLCRIMLRMKSLQLHGRWS